MTPRTDDPGPPFGGSPRPRRTAGGVRLRAFAMMLALAAAALAPGHAAAEESGIAAAIGGIFAAADAEAVSPVVEGERADLSAFYESRDYRPLWVGPSDLLPRAGSLIEVMRNADRHGLLPEHYGTEALSARLAADTDHERAALDVLMSAAYLHFMGELSRGRMGPKVVNPGLFAFDDDFDRAAALDAAAGTEDIAALADAYAPRMEPYQRLADALPEYRAIAERGGWPVVPDGPTLKPGMRDPRVADLQARLGIEGEPAETGPEPPLVEDDPAETAADEPPRFDGDPAEIGADQPPLFDDRLERAVIRFQKRHGLEPDGLVGPNTLRALNVGAEERARQIALNMERWRWMPEDLGDRHILVNIAGFEVAVIEHGEAVLHMRAIVGRPYRRTPVFSEMMSYLEFNPTWTVPTSIARLDILPKLKANPDYLADNGFELYAGWTADAPAIDPATVDWQAMDARHMPFRMVQRPGPTNALGQVKFMFPNRYSVYLHDTPSPALFARAARSFSSGCIRVEKPIELARYLLADVPGWDEARIRQVLASGRQTRVSLATQVPVHLTYATAWVDRDGVVQFRDDIYGRDAELADALLTHSKMH